MALDSSKHKFTSTTFIVLIFIPLVLKS